MTALLSNVRQWNLRRTAERDAAADLRTAGARRDVLACYALAALNRHAKQCAVWDRDTIYSLKRAMIGELLEAWPAKITRAVQRWLCRSCGGSGEWCRYGSISGDLLDVDRCWSCNGTGVYRTIPLLLFAFNVDGARFAWHQPAEFWPRVEIADAEPELYTPPAYDPRARLSERQYERHLAVVRQWIRAHGLGLRVVPAEPTRSLWVAIRGDVRAVQWWLRSDVRWRLRRIANKWRARLTDAQYWGPDYAEEGDALPF